MPVPQHKQQSDSFIIIHKFTSLLCPLRTGRLFQTPSYLITPHCCQIALLFQILHHLENPHESWVRDAVKIEHRVIHVGQIKLRAMGQDGEQFKVSSFSTPCLHNNV